MNLNVYRNAHHQILNEAKVEYKNAMRSQILRLPQLQRIKVKFVVYPKTRIQLDIGNVCSVTEKFFLDALVDLGKIPDDNYKFVRPIIYDYGKVDKNNPRVEVLIEEI